MAGSNPIRFEGGVRFPLPPSDREAGGLVFGVIAAAVVGVVTVATLQKQGVEAVAWQVYVLLAGLVIFTGRMLFGVVFPVGVVLSEGKFGLARRVFGRLVWSKPCAAADVRRLVVRSHGGTGNGELVAWLNESALPLAKNRPVADLRAVAAEVAVVLNATSRRDPVGVTDEDTRFTGSRTERPVYSDVGVSGDTLTLPPVSVVRERPVREVKAFGPTFRANVKFYLAGGLASVWGLLFGAVWIGGTVWAAGQLVFVGQSNVTVGPFDLRGSSPPDPLGVRLGLAAGAVLFAASVGGGAGFFGWWLGRLVWRDMKRTAAAEAVWRTDTTRRTKVVLTFTLTPESLVIAGLDPQPTCWAWADVRAAQALREELGGEEGGYDELLELRHASREVWRLRGLKAADWEYLATRLRTAAGRPAVPPAPTN